MGYDDGSSHKKMNVSNEIEREGDTICSFPILFQVAVGFHSEMRDKMDSLDSSTDANIAFGISE